MSASFKNTDAWAPHYHVGMLSIWTPLPSEPICSRLSQCTCNNRPAVRPLKDPIDKRFILDKEMSAQYAASQRHLLPRLWTNDGYIPDFPLYNHQRVLFWLGGAAQPAYWLESYRWYLKTTRNPQGFRARYPLPGKGGRLSEDTQTTIPEALRRLQSEA